MFLDFLAISRSKVMNKIINRKNGCLHGVMRQMSPHSDGEMFSDFLLMCLVSGIGIRH